MGRLFADSGHGKPGYVRTRRVCGPGVCGVVCAAWGYPGLVYPGIENGAALAPS